MVPIDSAWVVSYLTSIDPIIVSVTVFKIFDVKFNDLKLTGFKVIRGQCS